MDYFLCMLNNKIIKFIIIYINKYYIKVIKILIIIKMDNNLFNSLFSNLNNDSFNFTLPLNNNYDVINSIETMLEELQNNINITDIENNNEFVEFNIQFEFINENEHQNDNYFKDCNEINNTLGKPIKIKKNDTIEIDDCFICMENYKYLQYKRILPNCNHCFHKKCIDKWLKKKASCPVCRDELKKEDN